MSSDEKRIFINDLPETATQEDIKQAFENYGKVVSVEIKERKELGRKNLSLFFAYVNIQIDDRKLQQCFQDFSNGQWLGDYVPLQIARESFLERLRKERESNVDSNKSEGISNIPEKKTIVSAASTNGIVKRKKISKSSSVSSSSDTSDSENDTVKSAKNVSDLNKRKVNAATHSKSLLNLEENEIPDLIIKSNKGKVFDKTGLKIASVGKEPIVKIDVSKKKVNTSEANLKRLESLRNLKKGYQSQKLLIQTALSNVDNTFSKKIVYDDNIRSPSKQAKSNQENSKKSLFDENDLEEDFEGNFTLKEHFHGEKGQKLLELQSRYKNDKRFTLDSRFFESENQQMEENHEENEEITLEEEKNKEYEILEQVLGKRVHKMQKHPEGQRKKLFRFDPSKPEHAEYDMPKLEKKSKSKEKKVDVDLLAEKKREEKEAWEVSKETFFFSNYNAASQGDKEFTFGKFQDIEEADNAEEEQPVPSTKISTNQLGEEKNPFRYDSSDDEDETNNIPTQNDIDQRNTESKTHQTADTRNHLWSDPFFFKVDDYRLQEGFDFLEKMKLEENTEFTKLRRNLKEIVKAKVRNNQRKNKLFKKKLGGSKKKKVIRMKKAMKR